VEGADQRAISELMKLAEDWRLRFGQSDDFKAAIISSSSIVAGTCVGFCREDAASRATFDLCIVDAQVLEEGVSEFLCVRLLVERVSFHEVVIARTS